MLEIYHLVKKMMNELDSLLYVFLLAHVKFLVTATIALATYPQLSVDEIFIASSLGAISCFNIFYFISQKIYFLAIKQKVQKAKKSKTFKKRNRILIKMKQSKIHFFLVCTLAPLFFVNTYWNSSYRKSFLVI